MDERDPIAASLEAWRATTQDLAPPAGLADRMLAEVARQPSPLWSALARGGRRALVAGALGAALLSLVALRSVRSLEDRVADVALSGWTE